MSATTRPLRRVTTPSLRLNSIQWAVRQLVSRSFLAQSVLRDCARLSPQCTTKEHSV